MRSRALRVTLTLLTCAAVGGAGYFYWTTRARLDASIAAEASVHEALTAATRTAFDLRSAQQAYVAAAQNDAYWFEKVSLLASELRTRIDGLASARGSAAAATLADGLAALDEFEERDRRVRGYVSSGQRLLASDVIYSDGTTLTSRILDSLERAGAAAVQQERTGRAAAVRDQSLAIASAAVVALAALLLLLPAGDSSSETSPSTPRAGPQKTLDLELRPELGRRQAEAVQPSAPSPPPAAPTPAPPASAHFEDVARLCTDLARVSDTATIPSLLERTAQALDASGIVLWVAGAERRDLVPIAAHGYSSSVLSRLGTLEVNAENVTAAAFRTGLLQTVRGSETGNGAIAAPLVTPSGCMGVMSAEMRHRGEVQRARLAAASIVAAQLATIIGPPAAPADERGSAAW